MPARSAALRPRQWGTLPPSFQELGPSYRAADPEGVAAWAQATGSTVRQGADPPVTAAGLARLRMPIPLATGDADLYAPPAMLREIAAKVPAAGTAIVDECGHSAFWERPILATAAPAPAAAAAQRAGGRTRTVAPGGTRLITESIELAQLVIGDGGRRSG